MVATKDIIVVRNYADLTSAGYQVSGYRGANHSNTEVVEVRADGLLGGGVGMRP